MVSIDFFLIAVSPTLQNFLPDTFNFLNNIPLQLLGPPRKGRPIIEEAFMNVRELGIEWSVFKRGVRSLWDISESELDASGGDISKIENLVSSRYMHESPEIIHRMLNQLVDSYNNPTDHDPRGLYQTSFERRPPLSDQYI